MVNSRSKPTKETRVKISKALTGRKISEETRAKMSGTRTPYKAYTLKTVPIRLRPDQIEELDLIEVKTSDLIRAAVDLLLDMIHIREYTPQQAAAIAGYQQIAAEFPVDAIFIFNPKTLGGTFFYQGIPTAIANLAELAAAWDAHEPKKVDRRRSKSIQKK